MCKGHSSIGDAIIHKGKCTTNYCPVYGASCSCSKF